MKALIIHDYLDNIGGGEKLMLSLARGIKADVATLDYNPDVVSKMGFSDVKVIGFGSTLKVPPFKQIVASLRHRLCDFRKDYDYFILSGNWAHYAGARHHPNLWYCHTPVRAFYSDYDRLSMELPLHSRLLFKAWVSVHSRFDRRSVKGLDRIVANSKNTQSRVKRYYGLDCGIVYPGIDLKKYRFIGSGDYWLSVNRLYPEKRVDLQSDAFRLLPDERLVVVGGTLFGDHSSGYADNLMAYKPSNVEYRGRVSEEELLGLYGQCKGLICTAADEDFGMTPVEAMACGKPVVATREGGYLESVVDDVTGVFADANPSSLAEAVSRVGKDPVRFRRGCEIRARDFSLESFVNGIQEKMGA